MCAKVFTAEHLEHFLLFHCWLTTRKSVGHFVILLCGNQQHGKSQKHRSAADKGMPGTMADGCYGKLTVYGLSKGHGVKPTS